MRVKEKESLLVVVSYVFRMFWGFSVCPFLASQKLQKHVGNELTGISPAKEMWGRRAGVCVYMNALVDG